MTFRLYDSEGEHMGQEKKKRCWQKHTSQKTCHNFPFHFSKQLKWLLRCLYLKKKIKFKLQVNCINSSRFTFPLAGMELDSWQGPTEALGYKSMIRQCKRENSLAWKMPGELERVLSAPEVSSCSEKICHHVSLIFGNFELWKGLFVALALYVCAHIFVWPIHVSFSNFSSLSWDFKASLLSNCSLYWYYTQITPQMLPNVFLLIYNPPFSKLARGPSTRTSCKCLALLHGKLFSPFFSPLP